MGSGNGSKSRKSTGEMNKNVVGLRFRANFAPGQKEPVRLQLDLMEEDTIPQRSAQSAPKSVSSTSQRWIEPTSCSPYNGSRAIMRKKRGQKHDRRCVEHVNRCKRRSRTRSQTGSSELDNAEPDGKSSRSAKAASIREAGSDRGPPSDVMSYQEWKRQRNSNTPLKTARRPKKDRWPEVVYPLSDNNHTGREHSPEQIVLAQREALKPSSFFDETSSRMRGLFVPSNSPLLTPPREVDGRRPRTRSTSRKRSSGRSVRSERTTAHSRSGSDMNSVKSSDASETHSNHVSIHYPQKRRLVHTPNVLSTSPNGVAKDLSWKLTVHALVVQANASSEPTYTLYRTKNFWSNDSIFDLFREIGRTVGEDIAENQLIWRMRKHAEPLRVYSKFRLSKGSLSLGKLCNDVGKRLDLILDFARLDRVEAVAHSQLLDYAQAKLFWMRVERDHWPR